MVGTIILDLLKNSPIQKSKDNSLSFKFESNALTFEIDYELDGIKKGYFPHIGTSAREGICLMYKLSSDKTWMNINSYSKVSPVSIDMSKYIEENTSYEIIIYGPIINKLSKLLITVPDEYSAKIIDEVPQRNIVVAGGFNTYGIGCTNTSTMFSHILERKFNAKVENLSYNTINYLNFIYNDYVNSNAPIADVCILELDSFSQNESVSETILPKLIPLMKKRCKKLIGWYAISDEKSYKKIITNNIIKDFIYNGDLEILDLSFLYNEFDDIGVYSSMYINDTGNILIYKKLEEVIRRLTQWNI